MSERIVVIVPTYNNEATIGAVIAKVFDFVHDIVVVNDGSTDTTTQILHEILKQENGSNRLLLVAFDKNKGKGCALRAGFTKASECGFTHAITLDADGQHFASDIPLFLEKIQSQPQTLFVGDRVLAGGGSNQPLRSRAGARFGAYWYHFITGITLADTQCGFRAYPLAAIHALDCKSHRYEYEQEVLIKAAWSGMLVASVPIHLHYLSKQETVSHFRPFRDFARISYVNSKAAMTKLFLPFLIIDLPGATWKQKVVALFKRELSAHLTPKRASASLSIGVFFGLFPIYGFQVISLMALSVICKLNKPLAFLGVSISSPPFLPFIIAAAVAIGKYVVPTSLKEIVTGWPHSKLLSGGIEWFFGSIVLSIICSGVCWAISYPFFLQLAKKASSKKNNNITL